MPPELPDTPQPADPPAASSGPRSSLTSEASDAAEEAGLWASDVAPMPVATGSAMAFLRWLESAGNAQQLRSQAGQHLFNQPTTPQPPNRVLRRLLDTSGLWVYADELHGNQAVSQDLRQRSIAASVLLSGSSLIDYISSLGLFAFIFRLAPAGPLPYTLGLSTLLLLFGNWSGRSMVDRHKGQAIPNISLSIFIALSIFQSLTAGIGVFLFNGQARVVEARAEALIQSDLIERRRRIRELLDPANPTIANDQEACNANRLQLGQIGASNAAYQQLSVETFGRWEDRRVAPANRPRWELEQWPLARWPLCPRVEQQRSVLQQQAADQRRALTSLESQIRQAPSRAEFLAATRPQVFAQVFLRAADGRIELKDGVQAFGAAWDFFWNPPADYRSDLILSWVYMTISVITSAGAIALLYWQSQADNTRTSVVMPYSAAVATRTSTPRFPGPRQPGAGRPGPLDPVAWLSSRAAQCLPEELARMEWGGVDPRLTAQPSPFLSTDRTAAASHQFPTWSGRQSPVS